MSKATNQSIVMLSVVAGCLVAIMDQKAFSRVDMKERLDKAIIETLLIADKWPTTGNKVTNSAWREVRFEQWKIYLMTAAVSFKPAMMLAVADRVVTELSSRIRNKDSLAKLSSIAGHLKVFSDFVDPAGRNFPAYEDSGRIMDELERIIEWNS